MTHEHLKKGEMRLIEMHMMLDANGKIQVSPQLMEALGIQPGDMLSFYFDDNGVHVKGGKKPPYVHTSPSTQQTPRAAKPPTRRKRRGI